MSQVVIYVIVIVTRSYDIEKVLDVIVHLDTNIFLFLLFIFLDLIFLLFLFLFLIMKRHMNVVT